MRARRGEARAVVGAAIAAVTLLAGLAPTSRGADPDPSGQPPPNIVLIVTDDQTYAQLTAETMPRTTRLLGAHGTTFSDAVVSIPLCCPSRAAMMTGQYGHNNGVLNNSPGYPELRAQGNVLPVWLQRAGYRTAHVGKFLNGFEKAEGEKTTPPGWDDWLLTTSPRGYYDFRLIENGSARRYGSDAHDYLTRVLNRKAARLIRRHVPGPEPLYLQIDQYAPHNGGGTERGGECQKSAIPDDRDRDGIDGFSPVVSPAVNEADTSDKPTFMGRLPPLAEDELDAIARKARCDLASLQAVDRGVARVHRALRTAGELSNTVIAFTSDNGYSYGEHRVTKGKSLPYEELIHVPLMIRAPRAVLGSPPASGVDDVVANIDLAPTFLDLAGATPCRSPGACRVLDGRSLVPLLRGERAGWPRDRAILIEHSDGGILGRVRNPKRSCGYAGVRTRRYLFVRHSRTPLPDPIKLRTPCAKIPEAEFYDLALDPFELENLRGPHAFPPPAATPEFLGGARLGQRLRALRPCAGLEARDRGPLPRCE